MTEETTAPALRVLVVDDDRDTAETLAQVLEGPHCSAISAFNGEQALEMADQHRPNVIVLDLDLSGMTGFEVCRRIRQKPWGSTVRIIAYTGWAQLRYQAEAEAAGCDAFLVKPASIETLEAAITASEQSA